MQTVPLSPARRELTRRCRGAQNEPVGRIPSNGKERNLHFRKHLTGDERSMGRLQTCSVRQSPSGGGWRPHVASAGRAVSCLIENGLKKCQPARLSGRSRLAVVSAHRNTDGEQQGVAELRFRAVRINDDFQAAVMAFESIAFRGQETGGLRVIPRAADFCCFSSTTTEHTLLYPPTPRRGRPFDSSL